MSPFEVVTLDVLSWWLNAIVQVTTALLSIVPPWWFNAVVQVTTTVLSIAAGVFVVVWQLGRQHRAALEQQRAQIRQQLRLDIYKDMIGRLNKAVESMVTFHIACTSTALNLGLRRQFLDQFGRPITTGIQTHLNMISMNSEASKSMISVLYLLEDYEIAFSGFEEIRRRFAERQRDLGPRFTAFFNRIGPFLTIIVSDQEARIHGIPAGRHTPTPPTAPEQQVIEHDLREMEGVIYDLFGFILDVKVAAQNHLLAEIFPGSQARERQPEDPRVVVLRPMREAPEGRR